MIANKNNNIYKIIMGINITHLMLFQSEKKNQMLQLMNNTNL
jgi:hypothetical protein